MNIHQKYILLLNNTLTQFVHEFFGNFSMRINRMHFTSLSKKLDCFQLEEYFDKPNNLLQSI